jgi:hypothetical protein
MAIHISPAPAEGANVVQRNLTPPRTRAMGMAATTRGSSRTMKPYPIFSADLEDVLDDDPGLLASARLTSWQYVVFEGETVVALAEVTHVKPLRYASGQSPVVAEAVLKAIRKAEELDAVEKADYELRILRVPELYLLAVWLHGRSEDLLIPVRPFTKTSSDRVSFSEEQMVEILRPLAQVRFATPDA